VLFCPLNAFPVTNAFSAEHENSIIFYNTIFLAENKS